MGYDNEKGRGFVHSIGSFRKKQKTTTDKSINLSLFQNNSHFKSINKHLFSSVHGCETIFPNCKQLAVQTVT